MGAQYGMMLLRYDKRIRMLSGMIAGKVLQYISCHEKQLSCQVHSFLFIGLTFLFRNTTKQSGICRKEANYQQYKRCLLENICSETSLETERFSSMIKHLGSRQQREESGPWEEEREDTSRLADGRGEAVHLRDNGMTPIIPFTLTSTFKVEVVMHKEG